MILEVTSEGVKVSADPKRVHKLTLQIEQILANDCLEPEMAAKLAGKLGFVQSTAFGKTGSAALRPLHSRANSTGHRDAHLNVGLRGALSALRQILSDLTPRFVPFVQPSLVATVYTDAFFELGDTRWHVGDENIPANMSFQKCCSCRNGWGFVVRIGSHVTYGHGSVSPGLLKRFCSRRAFIYFLEIYAQLVAFCTHVDALPAFWIAYVDNQPGMSALQKGFGRDEDINVILTGFWSLATKMRWVPEFRWVPSALNIADPVSRADFSIVQKSWRRLASDCRELEALLLRLDSESVSAFPDAVRSLEWQWDPPWSGVGAPSDG